MENIYSRRPKWISHTELLNSKRFFPWIYNNLTENTDYVITSPWEFYEMSNLVGQINYTKGSTTSRGQIFYLDFRKDFFFL